MGLMVANASSTMAPWGGRTPFFGTKIAVRERMVELSAQWKRLVFGLGVGVSLGYATVGMVGH